ncbi:MAG: cytochrome c [Rhodothermales bacterium]
MKKALKIVFSVIGALLAIVVVAVFVLYLIGKSKFNDSYDYTPVITEVSSDSAAVARGAHVLAIEACRECHGENLAGNVIADAPPFLIAAPNLTSGKGGIGAGYTPSDWDKAIRSGVAKDGRGLIIMPAEIYKNLSNQDAEALIAYLQQVAPVDHELPKREIRLLGYIIAATAGPLTNTSEPGHAPAVTPEQAPTDEFGKYLATTSCEGCHGPKLDGIGAPGGDPDSPPPPSLAAAAAWSLDDFMATIRTGVNPNGRELQAKYMPWKSFRNMTDVELEALHTHLQHVFAAH